MLIGFTVFQCFVLSEGLQFFPGPKTSDAFPAIFTHNFFGVILIYVLIYVVGDFFRQAERFLVEQAEVNVHLRLHEEAVYGIQGDFERLVFRKAVIPR